MFFKGDSGHFGHTKSVSPVHAYKYRTCRLEIKPIDAKDEVELRGL